MILSIILLILLILTVPLLILFLIYIMLPSIKVGRNGNEDPVISTKETQFTKSKTEIVPNTNQRALVMCNCEKKFKVERTVFNKEHTCALMHSLKGNGTDCKYACIGLGDCMKGCPQNAIIIKNHTAKISSLCIGCGKCVDSCPMGIIKMVPKDLKEVVLCGALEKYNSQDNKTTCDSMNKKEKVEWNTKKDFKIWSYCYKISRYIFERNTKE